MLIWQELGTLLEGMKCFLLGSVFSETKSLSSNCSFSRDNQIQWNKKDDGFFLCVSLFLRAITTEIYCFF